jgi:hypothetical protein
MPQAGIPQNNFMGIGIATRKADFLAGLPRDSPPRRGRGKRSPEIGAASLLVRISLFPYSFSLYTCSGLE